MTVKVKSNKRITVVFVILSIIGVLFLCKIAVVLGLSSYMNAKAKEDDPKTSEIVATYYLIQALSGDFMEPYIAYYNAGTSLAKSEPEAAERLLEKSLTKVDNDPNECYVRNNLAIVQEKLGDYYMVADMASTAEAYYAKAVTTISESPLSCFPPPPQGGDGDGGEENGESEEKSDNPLTPEDGEKQDAENGENMEDTEERSKQKEGEAQDAQGEGANGKEQVEKEMDQSKSEMDNREDVSDQQENQSGNQVDKPW